MGGKVHVPTYAMPEVDEAAVASVAVASRTTGHAYKYPFKADKKAVRQRAIRVPAELPQEVVVVVPSAADTP